MRLLCITASVGRSRSVKNAADTKLFAAPGLAKSKYRRFSRPTSTAMHKRRSKNQVGLNYNYTRSVQTHLKREVFSRQCGAFTMRSSVFFANTPLVRHLFKSFQACAARLFYLSSFFIWRLSSFAEGF
jgi:hypothetical protein